jgi:imidazolonepropionase-like amidohydrolase
LAALPLSASPGQPPPVAIVNVSVVPMDREHVLVGQTVVVAGGRISAIGPASTVTVPAGAVRIDGAGQFLMPGLADMHAHFATSGNAARDSEENEHLASIFVAHGITTVRSMRGSPEILELRKRIDAGDLPGPQVFTTGPINGASQPNTRRVATVAEAESLVSADKAAGYDAIKLTNLSPEIYVAFLAAARREGLPVYGHVPRPVTFDIAARGGLGSAEHVIPFAVALVPPEAPRAASSGPASLAPEHADWALFPPIATKLRENGVWVCPTLVVAERFPSAEKRRRLADATMRYVPRRLRDAWAADVDNESAGPVPRLLDFGLTLTKRLHEAGVGLLLGSDDMNPYIVPGLSLHEELGLFVRAGLTPFEALRTGTADAARFLHREREFGTIAVGRRADLLLLEANPLENVANARRRAGVMIRGHWFPESDLRRRLRTAAEAFAK